MRKIVIICALLVAFSLKSFSQPYSLKKELKPIKIELIADNRKGHEGEKNVVFNHRVSDSANYHYLKGYDMYQMVDVLVYNAENNVPLDVELVKDNWDHTIQKQNTKSAKENVVNFKFRDYGNVGIKVTPPKGTSCEYIIAAIASAPRTTNLGSPFVKMNKDKTAAFSTNTSNKESNTLLYILLGIAALVIAFLLGKIRTKNTTKATILLLFLSMSISAQQQGRSRSVEEYIQEASQAESNAQNQARDFILGKLVGIRESWEKVESYHNEYTSVTNCVPTGGLPDSPNIPSFCAPEPMSDDSRPLTDDEILELDEASDCSNCFQNARTKFNETRYKLQKLKTIYNCTKRYSNAAIALGDNASGIHAVVGMTWQKERVAILKKLENLEKEYDETYKYLMNELKTSMMELNFCEEEFGVADWFNRFGFSYFEFMKENYRRND